MTLIRLRMDATRFGTCSAPRCRAPLTWFRTLDNKAMPMNRGAMPVKTDTDPALGLIGWFDNAETHWATCPARDRFARRR